MKKLLRNNDADMGIPYMVVGVVAFLIAVIIGLMVWYKIDTSILTNPGFPAGAVTAAASINTTANSVWTLAPIVGLVLIAGVIIGTIMMFAGGKRM